MSDPCTVIRHRLAAGEPLAEPEARHIEACPQCAVLIELPARLRQATAAAVEPRPGFQARVTAGARARLERRRRRTPMLVAASAAAALVVIAGAAWWLTRAAGGDAGPALAEHTAEPPTEQPDHDETMDELLATLSDTEAALGFTGGGTVDEAAEELGDLRDDIFLDDDQRARVRRIADQVEKEVVRLQAEIDILNIDLRGELEKPRPDPAAIERAIDRIGALEAEVRKKRILGWLRARQAVDGAATPPPPAQPAADPDDDIFPKPLPPPPDRSVLEDPFADPPDGPRGTFAEPPATNPFDAEPVREGSVAIQATPWARVHIDGKAVGTTPMVATLAPGRHQIRIERDGFETVTRTVEVDPDKSIHLSVQLAEK